MTSEGAAGSARVIRSINEAEKDDYWGLMTLAFHEDEGTEARDVFLAILGLERTWAVYEDAEIVGTGGAFDLTITAPGLLPVKAGGVTGISVRPTHRRRGVLSSMLRRHLTELHETGGAPLSILMASEPQIYGRFGYGLSTEACKLAIQRSAAALHPVAGIDKFRLRLVDPEAGYAACAAVYDEAVAARPAMLARTPEHKQDALADYEHARHGYGKLLCVVAEEPDGTVAAYARYRTKQENGGRGRPGSKVLVKEVYARDVASYAAVWRYLLDLDLTDEVYTSAVPLDDPILHLLVNPRAAQPELKDHLYTRLADVDRALAARRYTAPVDVVFDVADAFCPWNAGRWRLTGDASGATCARTTDPADLKLDVHELGRVYFGGVTLGELGRAGLVQELTPGALAAASLAFRSDIAPWLPYGF